MPWYRINVRHGARSENGGVEYQWHDQPLKQGARNDVFKEVCKRWFVDPGLGHGSVDKVNRPSAQAAREMIAQYERSIAICQRMIERLQPFGCEALESAERLGGVPVRVLDSSTHSL